MFEKFLGKKEKAGAEKEKEALAELNNPETEKFTEHYFNLSQKLNGMIYEGERDTTEFKQGDQELRELEQRHGDEIILYAFRKAAKFKGKGMVWTQPWHWFLRPENIKKFGPQLSESEVAVLYDETERHFVQEAEGEKRLKAQERTPPDFQYEDIRRYQETLKQFLPFLPERRKTRAEEIIERYHVEGGTGKR